MLFISFLQLDLLWRKIFLPKNIKVCQSLLTLVTFSQSAFSDLFKNGDPFLKKGQNQDM